MPQASDETKPELLAPAGDWEAMRAAVVNGADAVYFGLSDFNARHRAANFQIEELPRVIDYLHSHNVRGYVTVNTLIFSDELPAIVQYISKIAEAGTDAVIVQDLGLVRLIKRIAPTLSVHGSTQMTLTEPRGIEFVKALGVERVILARESSLDDIRRIRQRTAMPVEVFVHGALCIAYSGQCLTSEALGGRSANRGQCAQACRLPYELIVDGQVKELGDKAYLLSPQDLAAADLIGELSGLGVVSFKIEGRLKSAQYVAAATSTYRAAVDAAIAHRPFTPSPQQAMDMQQSFSRGFSHGFFDGVDHQVLVQGRFPKHRGVRAGVVVDVNPRGVVIEPAPGVMLKTGDGVVFDEGHPEQDEQGGRVGAVRVLNAGGAGSAKPQAPGKKPQAGGARVEVGFHAGSVNLKSIEVGSIVWRTDDPAVRKRLEQTFARDQVVHRRRVDVHVAARAGGRLTLQFREESGRSATVESDEVVREAINRPLTVDVAREQLGRMGDSPFELGTVTLEGGVASLPVMAPKSVLNELRRRAVARLTSESAVAKRHAVNAGALERLRGEVQAGTGRDSVDSGPPMRAANATLPRLLPGREGNWRAGLSATSSTPARLTVLVRSMAQLEAVLAWKPPMAGPPLAMVYCEFEDIKRYKEAVAAARAVSVPIGLATTRVIKPSEEGLLNQVATCEPDAVLVRHLAGLSFMKAHAPHLPVIADYSLNIANELTASIIAEQGVWRMVPSFDLNWPQLTAMLGRFPAALFEAVVHQHMPMFHMEHCVFCATLSKGKDFRDCGRPCDDHAVSLHDRAGIDHPLVADVGCRNTVYNGVAQSAAEFVPRMLKLGIGWYRVELLREKAGEVGAMLERYVRVVNGLEDGRRTWSQLRVLNQLGVTRGTLDYD
jgi:putative protease